MVTFGAKLGMALFSEHVGLPLPETGRVYVQPFANGGLDQQTYDQAISILPAVGSLKMGRKDASSQFSYRYNTDEKSVVGAMAAFHDNLFFLVFAVSDSGPLDSILRTVTAAVVEPGMLLSVLGGGWGERDRACGAI